MNSTAASAFVLEYSRSAQGAIVAENGRSDDKNNPYQLPARSLITAVYRRPTLCLGL